MLKLIAITVGVLVLQACNGQAEQAVDNLLLSDPVHSQSATVTSTKDQLPRTKGREVHTEHNPALRTQIGDEQPAQHHGRDGR